MVDKGGGGKGTDQYCRLCRVQMMKFEPQIELCLANPGRISRITMIGANIQISMSISVAVAYVSVTDMTRV